MKQIEEYFKKSTNLTRAFIHRSYCNEHPSENSNERLEFLGDAILQSIISDRLYRLFPDLPEGELTGRRSQLVCTSSLAEKSLLLGFDAKLMMSHGEEESGGRSNSGLLANTFEAVLGALFLDSGMTHCYSFVQDVFPDTDILKTKVFIKDPKSLLQEKTQADGLGTPLYNTVNASGPDHAKNFTVTVLVQGKEIATAEGNSKQKAQTLAAKKALEILFPSENQPAS